MIILNKMLMIVSMIIIFSLYCWAFDSVSNKRCESCRNHVNILNQFIQNQTETDLKNIFSDLFFITNHKNYAEYDRTVTKFNQLVQKLNMPDFCEKQFCSHNLFESNVEKNCSKCSQSLKNLLSELNQNKILAYEGVIKLQLCYRLNSKSIQSCNNKFKTLSYLFKSLEESDLNLLCKSFDECENLSTPTLNYHSNFVSALNKNQNSNLNPKSIFSVCEESLKLIEHNLNDDYTKARNSFNLICSLVFEDKNEISNCEDKIKDDKNYLFDIYLEKKDYKSVCKFLTEDNNVNPKKEVSKCFFCNHLTYHEKKLADDKNLFDLKSSFKNKCNNFRNEGFKSSCLNYLKNNFNEISKSLKLSSNPSLLCNSLHSCESNLNLKRSSLKIYQNNRLCDSCKQVYPFLNQKLNDPLFKINFEAKIQEACKYLVNTGIRNCETKLNSLLKSVRQIKDPEQGCNSLKFCSNQDLKLLFTNLFGFSKKNSTSCNECNIFLTNLYKNIATKDVLKSFVSNFYPKFKSVLPTIFETSNVNSIIQFIDDLKQDFSPSTVCYISNNCENEIDFLRSFNSLNQFIPDANEYTENCNYCVKTFDYISSNINYGNIQSYLRSGLYMYCESSYSEINTGCKSQIDNEFSKISTTHEIQDGRAVCNQLNFCNSQSNFIENNYHQKQFGYQSNSNQIKINQFSENKFQGNQLIQSQIQHNQIIPNQNIIDSNDCDELNLNQPNSHQNNLNQLNLNQINSHQNNLNQYNSNQNNLNHLNLNQNNLNQLNIDENNLNKFNLHQYKANRFGSSQIVSSKTTSKNININQSKSFKSYEVISKSTMINECNLCKQFTKTFFNKVLSFNWLKAEISQRIKSSCVLTNNRYYSQCENYFSKVITEFSDQFLDQSNSNLLCQNQCSVSNNFDSEKNEFKYIIKSNDLKIININNIPSACQKCEQIFTNIRSCIQNEIKSKNFQSYGYKICQNLNLGEQYNSCAQNVDQFVVKSLDYLINDLFDSNVVCHQSLPICNSNSRSQLQYNSFSNKFRKYPIQYYSNSYGNINNFDEEEDVSTFNKIDDSHILNPSHRFNSFNPLYPHNKINRSPIAPIMNNNVMDILPGHRIDNDGLIGQLPAHPSDDVEINILPSNKRFYPNIGRNFPIQDNVGKAYPSIPNIQDGLEVNQPSGDGGFYPNSQNPINVLYSKCNVCLSSVQILQNYRNSYGQSFESNQLTSNIFCENQVQCQNFLQKSLTKYIVTQYSSSVSNSNICSSLNFCQSDSSFGGDKCSIGQAYYCVSRQHAQACNVQYTTCGIN